MVTTHVWGASLCYSLLFLSCWQGYFLKAKFPLGYYRFTLKRHSCMSKKTTNKKFISPFPLFGIQLQWRRFLEKAQPRWKAVASCFWTRQSKVLHWTTKLNNSQPVKSMQRYFKNSFPTDRMVVCLSLSGWGVEEAGNKVPQ